MSQKRKFAIITGTRAEYGLLNPLMELIRADQELELQLIVTGSHLSEAFGSTHREIEKDGFVIDEKIDLQLSAGDAPGICRSTGLALTGFGQSFHRLTPDMIVILGDRYEIFAAAAAGLLSGIPVAHISGGETTEGAYDESFRHAITKMSHIHFTSTEVYRRRVIQLGENPERVFNVGSPAIDNIRNLKLLGKSEFEQVIGRKLITKNLLITFHPVTLEQDTQVQQFSELLAALEQLEETLLIFTSPNADNQSRNLIVMLNRFVDEHPGNSLFFKSMGRLNYLSGLQFMDAVVGNSSSGIVEAPSFRIGTINIGNRQKGRIRAESVIDCPAEYSAIMSAFARLYSPEFQNTLEQVQSPFGEGNSSPHMLSILKSIQLEQLLRKPFHDLDFTPVRSH